MTPTGSTFLDIPTKKGFWTAFVVIVVFMVLAGLLYGFAGKSLQRVRRQSRRLLYPRRDNQHHVCNPEGDD